MQIQKNLYLLLIISLIFAAGCKRENAELKKSAREMADIMCKNIEAMNNLKAADRNDTATITLLQEKVRKIQGEMTGLYQEFKKKYGDKTRDMEFSKEFSLLLSKSMLDCPHLSKEQREQFMKEPED